MEEFELKAAHGGSDLDTILKPNRLAMEVIYNVPFADVGLAFTPLRS